MQIWNKNFSVGNFFKQNQQRGNTEQCCHVVNDELRNNTGFETSRLHTYKVSWETSQKVIIMSLGLGTRYSSNTVRLVLVPDI